MDVNEPASDSNHMIFQSIEQDDFHAVCAYLDAGLDPNVRGFDEETASVWVPGCHCWRTVEILISNGADLSLDSASDRSVASIV